MTDTPVARTSNPIDLSYEGQKDAWLEDLLTYLHFDEATQSHPDWVARAQDAEAQVERLRAALGGAFQWLCPPKGVESAGAALRDYLRSIQPLLNLGTSDETNELSRALHTIDEAGKLSDWINLARPVVTDLMQAYERRIRTDCTPEQLAKEPWRCMEYIAAERLLAAQPIAVVEITAVKASGCPTHGMEHFFEGMCIKCGVVPPASEDV